MTEAKTQRVKKLPATFPWAVPSHVFPHCWLCPSRYVVCSVPRRSRDGTARGHSHCSYAPTSYRCQSADRELPAWSACGRWLSDRRPPATTTDQASENTNISHRPFIIFSIYSFFVSEATNELDNTHYTLHTCRDTIQKQQCPNLNLSKLKSSNFNWIFHGPLSTYSQNVIENPPHPPRLLKLFSS